MSQFTIVGSKPRQRVPTKQVIWITIRSGRVLRMEEADSAVGSGIRIVTIAGCLGKLDNCLPGVNFFSLIILFITGAIAWEVGKKLSALVSVSSPSKREQSA